MHSPDYFIPPEIPENPNIIIVGESPGEEELKQHKPFIGPSGRLLRHIFERTGANPIILNSRQCYGKDKPTTEQIKANREAFLLPILSTSDYAGLPIVALGAFGSSYVSGGKRTETSLVNRVIELYNRRVSFTYHPAYYFYKGRDERILDHIEITIESAIRPVETPKYITGILPRDVEEIVIDAETTSNKYPWYGSELVILGIMPIGKPPYIIKASELTPEYKQFLNEKVKKVIGHNLIFDLIFCAFNGITFPNASFHDTLIYHKNLFPNELFNDLKFLARKYFNFPQYEAWFDRLMLEKVDIRSVDFDKLAAYNARDLYAPEQLYLKQTQKYYPFLLEMDYLPVVRDMTMNGVHFDKKKLQCVRIGAKKELKGLLENTRKKYNLGEDFNFRSHPQILSLLSKYIKKLPNTQEPTLTVYENEFPIVKDIIGIRRLEKFIGTSIGNVYEKILEDGLVHSVLRAHGAETSRSSSSDPNLQNTDPKIRSSSSSRFEDGKLIYADLSALEYRLIAHVSGELKLIRLFKNNENIHKGAYQNIFGRMPESEEEYLDGKKCNFAAAYGAGFNKWKDLTGLKIDEARKTYKKIVNLYREVQLWKQATIQRLRDTGFVYNLFGRRREFLFPITQDDEREAINWIIQSSGHDILKLFILIIADSLPKSDEILIILEVHDSVTIDCSGRFAEQVFNTVKAVSDKLTNIIMESFGIRMRVPIFAKVEMLEEWK